MTADFSQLKAVIFDMDGVLFLSGDCHAEAFRGALAEVGINEFSYPTVAGMRTDEAFKKIYASQKLALDEPRLSELVKNKQARVRSALERDSRVNNYADDLIGNLRNKFRLVLASSASRPTIEIFLQKIQDPTAFEFCLDGSVVKEAKPAPEIYLLAAERLSLSPSECLVIEDALSGIQAALAAKMAVIAVTGTERRAVLDESGAHQVITGLQELESLL